MSPAKNEDLPRLTYEDLPEYVSRMFAAMEPLIRRKSLLPVALNEWDEAWHRDHSGRNLDT